VREGRRCACLTVDGAEGGQDKALTGSGREERAMETMALLGAYICAGGGMRSYVRYNNIRPSALNRSKPREVIMSSAHSKRPL
jgi:hypothetical protein